MALPSPAPRWISTSCPCSLSSRAPMGVSATRYSSVLISVGTPTFTAQHLLRFASGGVAVSRSCSPDQLPRAQRQPQLDAVRGPRQVAARQLLDLADPVPQRVPVAVELPSRALPIP